MSNQARTKAARRCFCVFGALTIALVVALPAFGEDVSQTVRIGVLAKRGTERCMEKWSPTAKYLSDNIPGHSFEIVPLSYDEVVPAVKDGEVDFIFCNPALYVEVEALYGAGRIATLKNLGLGGVYTIYGGVIFRRADREDIKDLYDLKGKRFMAVDEASLGGWLAAWREMKEVGIDPYRDFREIIFGGTHDMVVYAVRDGKVDAGTVRIDTLERMAAEGNIRMEDFHVLGHDHVGEEVCDFPFLHSTDLYPEWPFAAVRHTSTELAEKVAVDLLGMPSDCPAAKAANCAGWTIPGNYQPVHECLKELRVGSYKDYGKVTLGQAVGQHWYWLVVIVAALAAMSGATAYVLRLNRRLHQMQSDLQNELAERKKAEEALKAERDKLRALVSGLGDTGIGIDIIGADYRVLFQNGILAERFGDVVGKLCYEEYMGRDEPCDFCPMSKAIASGANESIELTAADGRQYEILVAPLANADGTVDSAIEVVRDITERKEAEEALESSESKFRTLYEATSDAVMLLDEKGFFDCNEATLRIFGCDSREQFLDKHPSELSPATQPDGRESRGAADEKIATAMTEGTNRFEWLHCRVDGAEFPAEVLLNSMKLGGRTVLQAVVRDISERKEVEEQLRRAKQAAEDATRAKSEFLANMSHEIRTPLTAILGYADLVMDPRQDPSERLNCLVVIRRNGEHLLDLIDDILDISRIEAGKFTIAPHPCSIPSVVAEVVSMMRVRADERGISLTAEYTGELPETIITDDARLRQCLVNLVGNAVKFTETGGVRLVISFLPEWRDSQPAVRIDVADTGIGIAPADLKKLFRPFTQVDSSTSRKYEGSGLGLAITRHIVELMGGQLSAESTVGKGSAFTITIPTGNLEGVEMLEHPAEAVVRRPTGAGAYSSDVLAGKHILLAEDGEDNMRLIRAILRKAGADVACAGNGRIAVTQAMREPFDLILMDMQMPEMDGYQATSYLRSAGYSGPVIALTAHAMSGDRDRCILAGCDDYLSKPIDREHLIASIARYFEIEATGGETLEATEPEAENDEVIRSGLADEADLAEIIDEFVAGLPARLEEMRQAAAHGDHERLRRLAHQLKGAGGGYGYPMLTDSARAVEDAAKAGDIEAANLALKKLAVLCRAVVRGHSDRVASETRTDEGSTD